MKGVHTADPLADAVVDDFAGLERGAGMAMFRAALADGIDSVADAPDSLRAFFAEVVSPTGWSTTDLTAPPDTCCATWRPTGSCSARTR